MSNQYTGYVYIWHDKKHNMFYVGSHFGQIDDSYICSSKWMLNAHKKRPIDFKMRVLKYIDGNIKDLQNEEQRWLNMITDSELSISKNVMEGCNRYYNMKKTAVGGSHKGHTKNRIKPAWNKGLTPEMIQSRRSGDFMLLIDKPIKNPNRTGRPKGCIAWNKGIKMPRRKKVAISSKPITTPPKKNPPVIKICIKCGSDFVVEYIKRKKLCCSMSCSNSLNAKKGSPAINGKRSAKKQSKTVAGRKRKYLDDGSWTWQYPQSDGSWSLMS